MPYTRVADVQHGLHVGPLTIEMCLVQLLLDVLKQAGTHGWRGFPSQRRRRVGNGGGKGCEGRAGRGLRSGCEVNK